MYAAKRFSCGPGAERRDPTKQVYTNLFFYDPVVLTARGISSCFQEAASARKDRRAQSPYNALLPGG